MGRNGDMQAILWRKGGIYLNSGRSSEPSSGGFYFFSPGECVCVCVCELTRFLPQRGRGFLLLCYSLMFHESLMRPKLSLRMIYNLLRCCCNYLTYILGYRLLCIIYPQKTLTKLIQIIFWFKYYRNKDFLNLTPTIPN